MSETTPESTPQAPKAGRSRATVAVLTALAVGVALGGLGVRVAMHQHSEGNTPAPAAAKKGPLYQCPMHPSVTSDHPGDCPICGMKLVPVEGVPPDAGKGSRPSERKDEAQAGTEGRATVTIDPARQQLIGLRTAKVTRSELSATWRTPARIQVDPTRVRQINVKVDGFVERIHVNFVGQPVRKGEPLISVYSPSLLAAQNELLLALRTREALSKGGALADNGETLVAAARRRLELWDVPANEIDRLVRSGQTTKTLTLVSPISGVVTAKNVVQGARVSPGMAAYEITDLGEVWVMADAYETDLHNIRVGMKATLSLPAYPNRSFLGRVAFVDPMLDPNTRTTKVHLHFPNPKRELKPEMYGEVTLQGTERPGLRIPTDAVIRSGKQDVVFLARGEGKLEPRVVTLGLRNGAEVEVSSGLEEGQEVVTGANFLVDSESQLRASLSAIGGK